MRFVYRNRKLALFGLICLFGVMMILIKFTEFSPTCLFREEQAKPMMLRDEVSVHGNTFSIQFRNQLMRESISIEIYGWERPKLLSISSTNATDIHWRRAKIGHDTDACNVGRTSRCPLRPRDTRHSAYFAIAIALAEIREGKPPVRRSRNNERGRLLNLFHLRNRTIDN